MHKPGLPRVDSFSCSLSLPLLFRLIPWNAEAHWVYLLARASETHARGSPRWGTLRYSSGHLWSSLDGASSLSETLLVFHVNQVNQLLSSTHFSTTPFFPNLILIFLIKLSFPCLSISPSNHPGSTGAGPWQISPSISLISISYLWILPVYIVIVAPCTFCGTKWTNTEDSNFCEFYKSSCLTSSLNNWENIYLKKRCLRACAEESDRCVIW